MQCVLRDELEKIRKPLGLKLFLLFVSTLPLFTIAVEQAQAASGAGTTAARCILTDSKGLKFVYVGCLYGGEIEQLCANWGSLFANGSFPGQLPAGLNCSGIVSTALANCNGNMTCYTAANAPAQTPVKIHVFSGNITTPNTARNMTTSQIQNNTKSQMSTSTVNMAKYRDPQGRFQINYPTNWTVKSATNRFQPVVASFSSGAYTNRSFASVDIGIDNVPTQTDPALYMKPNGVPGFSVFQNIECVKYKIDGNKACDIVLTGNPSENLPIAVLQVASYVDKKMYTFTMAGSQDDFDSYVPTFEKTLTSFKAPAMAANSNNTVNETNRVNETTLQNTLNRLATSSIAGVNESTSHNSTAGANKTTPLNMTTGTNKTTPQTTNMTTYKDPQNRFSVSYPTNWTVTPATNRFETNLLDIKDTPGPTGGNSISLILSRSGTDPELTANASASIYTSTLFQPVECTKYKVDGQKACSFITANSAIFPGTSGRVVMEVDSYVGGNMYALIFGSDSDKFDSVLPIYNTMIQSLHFSAAGNSTGGGNVLAQTNNSTLSLFSNASNILGNVSKAIENTYNNLNKTITSEQCDKARHTTAPANVSSFIFDSVMQKVLKACAEAGK